jgi:predicted CXXCH cytochrome family protein
MNYLNRLLVFIAIQFVILFMVSCTPELPEDVDLAYSSLPDELDYNIHVKPILSDKCFSCHGPDQAKQKAGLRLDVASFAFDEANIDVTDCSVLHGGIFRLYYI